MSNYIVDPLNGDDLRSGLDGNAWKTIKKATDTAQPGDNVMLRGGDYLPNDGNAGLRTKRSGAAGAFITFQPYGNEFANIKHQYIGAALFHNYIALKKLNFLNDIQGAMGQGILHWGTSAINHILLEDINVKNIQETESPSGIRMEMVDDSIIRRCTVDVVGTAPQPGPERGNALWVAGLRNTVEDCITDHAGHAGLFLLGNGNVVRRSQFLGRWGVCGEYLCYGRTDYRNLIEQCLFANASMFENGLWANPAWQQMGSGTLFRNNHIVDGVGSGVQFYSRTDYQAKYNRYCHNEIHGCGFGGRYKSAAYQLNEDVDGTQGYNIIKNSRHYNNGLTAHQVFAGYATTADIAFSACTWDEASPLMGLAQALTLVTTSGSGNIVPVADATWLWDDDIVFINTRQVHINHVNVANNTIELQESIAYSVGDQVFINRDIGRYSIAEIPPVIPIPDKSVELINKIHSLIHAWE